MRRSVLIAVFLSGASGLMHEVVWSKLLVQLVGATAHAQAVVLGVFMVGLALGAYWLGRRSDAAKSPLRIYFFLELAVGVYCLSLPWLLELAGAVYVAAATPVFESAGMKLALRFALSASMVLVPAVLMGGTLPVLARCLVAGIETTRRTVGRLYALNSFGAVLGAGLAGFWMLPRVGVVWSLAAASLMNFAAAALVYPSSREVPATERNQSRKKKKKAAADALPGYSPSQYVVTLVALAASGFAAMGYEVVFSRLFSLAFGSSTYSFSVMLMCFISGIALGSALVAKLRVERPLRVFAVSQLAVVVALAMAAPLVSRLAYWSALIRIDLRGYVNGFGLYQLGKAGLALTVLLVPTTCLGFGFPIVSQIQVRRPEQVGARVGSVYAWNTLGNVLGVLVTSLVMLPAVGTHRTFLALVAVSLLTGLALLLVSEPGPAVARWAPAAVSTAAFAVLAAVGSGWLAPILLAQNHLRLRTGPDASLDGAARARYPSTSFEAWKSSYVAGASGDEDYYYDEDSHAVVVVSGSESNLQLFVNTKPDASSGRDIDTQTLLSNAPFFLRPHAKSLLVIGYGSGITAGSALRHPVKEADIVEISAAVLGADFKFRNVNYGVLSDPRVRVYVDDAQSFLRVTPRRYDVIISEPTNPWIAGVAALFTREFFLSARDHLTPDGAFCLWLQAYEQSDENVALVLRTLVDVFANLSIFGDDDLSNLVVIASNASLAPDFAAMEARFAEPAVAADLGRMGIPNLVAFLSHHRISPWRASQLVTPGPLNTLGHERLEYDAPRRLFTQESSYFFDRVDPFVQRRFDTTDLLLDGYLRYRAASGRPVTRDEIQDAARYAQGLKGYGRLIAEGILQRGQRASSPPDP